MASGQTRRHVHHTSVCPGGGVSKNSDYIIRKHMKQRKSVVVQRPGGTTIGGSHKYVQVWREVM